MKGKRHPNEEPDHDIEEVECFINPFLQLVEAKTGKVVRAATAKEIAWGRVYDPETRTIKNTRKFKVFIPKITLKKART